jgi:hypothetical protein
MSSNVENNEKVNLSKVITTNNNNSVSPMRKSTLSMNISSNQINKLSNNSINDNKTIDKKVILKHQIKL